MRDSFEIVEDEYKTSLDNSDAVSTWKLDKNQVLDNLSMNLGALLIRTLEMEKDESRFDADNYLDGVVNDLMVNIPQLFVKNDQDQCISQKLEQNEHLKRDLRKFATVYAKNLINFHEKFLEKHNTNFGTLYEKDDNFWKNYDKERKALIYNKVLKLKRPRFSFQAIIEYANAIKNSLISLFKNAELKKPKRPYLWESIQTELSNIQAKSHDTKISTKNKIKSKFNNTDEIHHMDNNVKIPSSNFAKEDKGHKYNELSIRELRNKPEFQMAVTKLKESSKKFADSNKRTSSAKVVKRNTRRALYL